LQPGSSFTNWPTVSRAADGVTDGDADTVGEAETVGVAEAVGVKDGLGDADGVSDSDGDSEGDSDGVSDGVSDVDALAAGRGEAECVSLATTNASRIAARIAAAPPRYFARFVMTAILPDLRARQGNSGDESATARTATGRVGAVPTNRRSAVPAESLAGLADRHLHSGKVRDLYRVDDERVLVVASDRISAYDFILETAIPDKGAILTALSLWWFDQLAGVVPNHVISADVDDYPADLQPFTDALRGRSMLCHKLAMVPVECVARGYLTGSGYGDYVATGAICGHTLPAGLRNGDRLPEAIFTPATKADMGEHDENVSIATVAAQHGAALTGELERLTLEVYRTAAGIAEQRGVIIADTKFEFGHDGSGALVLGDEVLTPDSSRFWPADAWHPGQEQLSYDKQGIRDWLAKDSGWDRHSPPPPLPDWLVERTRGRYIEAYERITGRTFA
jgi:phosphoribosylaminoimidazole-succinocarboxamide synthase